jgi:hypothetical protein
VNATTQITHLPVSADPLTAPVLSPAHHELVVVGIAQTDTDESRARHVPSINPTYAEGVVYERVRLLFGKSGDSGRNERRLIYSSCFNSKWRPPSVSHQNLPPAFVL